MEVIGIATLAALVIKIVTVVKAFGKDWNKVLTQAVTWAVGIFVVWLGGEADVTAGLMLWDDVSLAALDGASIVLVGIQIASLGSFGYDVKKAVDRSDTAAEPPLLGPLRAPSV